MTQQEREALFQQHHRGSDLEACLPLPENLFPGHLYLLVNSVEQLRNLTDLFRTAIMRPQQIHQTLESMIDERL